MSAVRHYQLYSVEVRETRLAGGEHRHRHVGGYMQ